MYGPPSNTRSPSIGPRTSTPAGSSLSQGSFSPSDISIPPTPSPTFRRGRQPESLLNLAREQVRARGINPLEFIARPLREAGRRGGVGPIVVPPFTPSPSPLPSFIDFSPIRRRRRRQRRQVPARSPALADGVLDAGGGRRAAGGGRRAAEVEMMMMVMMMMMTMTMTIRISVLIVVTEGDRDSKSCYENFRGCNKITWKGVVGDNLPGSLIQIQLPPYIKAVVHPQ